MAFLPAQVLDCAMEDTNTTPKTTPQSDRRAFLRGCGKYSLTVPPVMTVLLSTSLSSPAIASSGGRGPRGNNGVGNGLDPQPPGNPPVNDGPGSGPGRPGNRQH